MELSPSGIPIIDLSFSEPSQVAQHVSKACKDAGCFYITNHGVDLQLIENTFHDLRTFFKQPIDYKMKFLDPNQNFDRGYHPFETQNVNAFMGRLGLPNDPLEKFTIGPPPGFIRPVFENTYPDIPLTLKQRVETYYTQLRQLAERLFQIFAIAANAPSKDFFLGKCIEGEHIIKANFYPKISTPKPHQDTRYAAHTDLTPFTILAMDDCPSALQIQNSKGEWTYADPVKGAFFVILGDVLAMWTNDKWKATVHRVVWPPKEQERLSIGFFVDMNPDAVMECLESCLGPDETPKYTNISFKEYVTARMNRLKENIDFLR